jgi:hypothetical protein
VGGAAARLLLAITEGEAAARVAVQIFPRFALISSPSLQTQTTKMGIVAWLVNDQREGKGVGIAGY